MQEWRSCFKVDPVPVLLSSIDEQLRIRTEHELMLRPVDLRRLRDSRAVLSLLRRQQSDGSWKYRNPRTVVPKLDNNEQVETFRSLGFLVHMYRMDATSPAIRRAADFILCHQTDEGDVRGIYGHQYTPNYTGALLALFIDAGMGNDLRVRRGLDWLLSVRQRDGGWAIPIRTRGMRLDADAMKAGAVARDPSKPSSSLATGMVLRAFASHPTYRRRGEVIAAAELLGSMLLRKDPYPDRGRAEYWERCSFPFWFTDIVSALDSLTLMGAEAMGPEAKAALRWLKGRQEADGTFRLHLVRGAKMRVQDWMVFAISRIFMRAYEDGMRPDENCK